MIKQVINWIKSFFSKKTKTDFVDLPLVLPSYRDEDIQRNIDINGMSDGVMYFSVDDNKVKIIKKGEINVL